MLLARLVLLREELRALAERQSAQPFWQDGGDVTATAEPAGSSTSSSTMGGGATAGSSQQPFFAFHRSNLPARCAAFLKNLLTVQERNKRLGLLNKVRASISKEQSDFRQQHLLLLTHHHTFRFCPMLCCLGWTA